MNITEVEKISLEEVPELMQKISDVVKPLGVHIQSEYTIKTKQVFEKTQVTDICIMLSCYKDGK